MRLYGSLEGCPNIPCFEIQASPKIASHCRLTGDIFINTPAGQYRLHGRGHNRTEEASQRWSGQGEQQNERDTDFCSQHVGVYYIFPAVYFTTLDVQ